MTTLRESLLGLAVIFTILVMVGLIVVGLESIMPPREVRLSQTEVDFHSACVAVKGRAVWNGRHWECLK